MRELICNLNYSKERPGWYWDFYDRTPVMSSYLLAIVVSEFTCVPAPPPGYKKYVEVCQPSSSIEKYIYNQ